MAGAPAIHTICGIGDFAELVFLGLKENGIDDIKIFDLGADGSSSFLGMTVHNLDTLDSKQYDRVLVSILGRDEMIRKTLQKQGASPNQMVSFFGNYSEDSRI